jgi:glycerophosphoryl diester phosphodiesterase
VPQSRPDESAAGTGRPLKIAHRGWHRDHLENTLEAFRAAYDAGCDMVEFDVQLSRDGVPVIFHDDDCKRLAGRADKVFDLDWAELKKIRMPGRGGRAGGLEGREYAIPSLAEFLGEFSQRSFYLELKVPDAKAADSDYYGTLAEKAASLVTKSHPRAETFLASFHGPILSDIAKQGLFPRLAGIFESYDRFLEVHSGRDAAVAQAIRYFSVSHRIFKRFLGDRGASAADGSRSAGNILIWNIDGEKDFRAAMAHGVYGLCSDDVEGLVRSSEL